MVANGSVAWQESPAWDGVSDVGRANEEHLGQVERHVLSHADPAGILSGNGWKEQRTFGKMKIRYLRGWKDIEPDF